MIHCNLSIKDADKTWADLETDLGPGDMIGSKFQKFENRFQQVSPGSIMELLTHII